MEVTNELITRLRKMVNDMVLGAEGAAEPLFSDAELTMMLEDAESIYQAAAEAWTIKAALLQGDIESYSVGDEKYELTSLKDRLDNALKMATKYEQKALAAADVPQGSVMLKFQTPDVL